MKKLVGTLILGLGMHLQAIAAPLNISGWDGTYGFRTMRVVENAENFEISIANDDIPPSPKNRGRYYLQFAKKDCVVVGSGDAFESITCQATAEGYKRLPVFRAYLVDDLAEGREIIRRPDWLKSASVVITQKKMALETVSHFNTDNIAFEFPIEEFYADGSGGWFNKPLAFPERLRAYIQKYLLKSR